MADTRMDGGPTPEELQWANQKADEARARLNEPKSYYDRLVSQLRAAEEEPGEVREPAPPPLSKVPPDQIDPEAFPWSLLMPLVNLILRNPKAEQKQQEQIDPPVTKI